MSREYKKSSHHGSVSFMELRNNIPTQLNDNYSWKMDSTEANPLGAQLRG